LPLVRFSQSADIAEEISGDILAAAAVGSCPQKACAPRAMPRGLPQLSAGQDRVSLRCLPCQR
jgi:hypothetical protein